MTTGSSISTVEELRIYAAKIGPTSQKDAAFFHRAAAELDRLHAEVERKDAALMDIAAKAGFELRRPTGMHNVCLAIIEKQARAALSPKETP